MNVLGLYSLILGMAGCCCLSQVYVKTSEILDGYGNDLKLIWFLAGAFCMLVAGILIGEEN